MNCEYFGKCGSCTLHDKTYEEQLEFKKNKEKKQDFQILQMTSLTSSQVHHKTSEIELNLEFGRISTKMINLHYLMQ